MSDNGYSGVVVKQEPACESTSNAEAAITSVNETNDDASTGGLKRSLEDEQDSSAKRSRIEVNERNISEDSNSHSIASPQNTVDDDERYLYSDEGTESTSGVNEYPTPSDTLKTCKLPLNIEEFLQFIYDWNPDVMRESDEVLINSKIQRFLKDMLSIYTYPSTEIFKVVNVPLILYQIYMKLREVNLISRRTKHMNCSILVKCHNTVTNTLDMKCILMRKPNEDLKLSFGNLVELRTVSQRKPNNPNVHISNRSYYGYVKNVFKSRRINLNNQCELNHSQLFEEEDRSKVLVDEFIISTKVTSELYTRTDFLLRMNILHNLFHYLQQARTVYDMDKYRIHSQFLLPKLEVRPSGLCIEVDPSKYNNEQLDAIQKCVDVVCNISKDPYFMCLKSSETSLSLAVMKETIKQLLSFVGQVKLLPKKIVVIAKSTEELKMLDSYLKDFKVCYLGSSKFQKQVLHYCKQAVKSKIKDIEENGEVNDKKALHKCYQQILQYFSAVGTNNVVDLSPTAALMAKNFTVEYSRKLLQNNDLIIGKLEDLCNDFHFYVLFKSSSRDGQDRSDPKIMCCFVYEADSFLEPELMSLLHFGIEKFILCDSTAASKQYNEDFLNRSMFSRLCNYSSLQKHNASTSSIVELSNSVDV